MFSAGVGRTGTYLAVEHLLQQAAAEDRVDVVGCIDNMRQQRVNMVQSLVGDIIIYYLTFNKQCIELTLHHFQKDRKIGAAEAKSPLIVMISLLWWPFLHDKTLLG